ncbi:MAG TPA: TIGR04053 family radical SAM/SPASM domain-containing protein [Candidatus Obscuribacterales bacterium]
MEAFQHQTMSAPFNEAPYIVLWELTRACALACRHCRADAIRRRDSRELSFEECERVLDELAQFGRPLIVFTGGDPVWRPDLFQIIRAARERKFTVAVTPSATPRTTSNIVRALKEAGVARLAVSLDGVDAASHDSFRGVRGSFAWTNDIINWARAYQIPLQINTTIWRGNLPLFDQFVQFIGSANAVLWSVFFLVPTGRAQKEMQISSSEAETVLKKMAEVASLSSFDIKATAAPHFRRVLMERMCSKDLVNLQPGMKLGALRSYQSVNDGKGILFISHIGDVYPSGFLPLSAGNVKDVSIARLYREHPLFVALRDPSLLKGKCGRCPYREICGGSRARAFGDCGDYLASDPLCSYAP